MNRLSKVLVVGKTRSIVHWVENLATAFNESGYQTRQFALNGNGIWPPLHYKLSQRLFKDASEPIRRDLERALLKFRPDLIVFVAIAALRMPENLFQTCRAICPQATLAVWIGDRLNREESLFANYADHVFVTDTAFADDLRLQGFEVPTSYLPLAVDTGIFRPLDVPRSDQIVYVANRSPGRGQLLEQITEPISLYGKGWAQLANTVHRVHASRLPWQRLPELYACSRAVLNIRNEKNVVNGLNQRSFEPYGCKTPVLHDDMADLPRCFEPGKEILVYRSLDELHELAARLRTDSTFASAVGEAGWERVRAEHTWRHRVQTISRLVQSFPSSHAQDV